MHILVTFSRYLDIPMRVNMIKRTNEAIIQQLKSEDERTKDDVLSYLYKVSQPIIKQFILKNKGNEQDVDDIFHDGLIAFYNLARQNKLKPDTNVEAYLYTICRNMWKKHLIKTPKQIEITDTFHAIATDELPIDRILSKERKALLNLIITQLGEECKQLLHLYYYERLRMKTIVKQMNFSNDQVARNKKASCMKKVRELVLSSSAYKNILSDK